MNSIIERAIVFITMGPVTYSVPFWIAMALIFGDVLRTLQTDFPMLYAYRDDMPWVFVVLYAIFFALAYAHARVMRIERDITNV